MPILDDKSRTDKDIRRRRKRAGGAGGWLACVALLAGLLPGFGWAPGEEEASSEIVPRYRALVIGISRYRHKGPDGWTQLLTARDDAAAVAEVLEQRYGFETVCLLDEQATLKAILGAFDRLANCSSRDAVLIYYAGHGYFDSALGEGFWIPHDARLTDNGRSARENWIWNSVLTKIIEASPARHVLVIADSCFGGSLFRGPSAETPAPDMTWYARALLMPSRYLITSGDREPVLDSGSRHSVFAQLLLNYLLYPEKNCFSASDVGAALRDKVGEMTGQMVRMGPLSVPTHAGGEFVFLVGEPGRRAMAQAIPPEEVAGWAGPSALVPVSAAEDQPSFVYRDIAFLRQQGVTNSAELLVRRAARTQASPLMPPVLAGADEPAKRDREKSEWTTLMSELEQKARERKEEHQEGPSPRVMAVMEASAPSDRTEDRSLAALYQMCLLSALNEQTRVRIAERELLEDVLRELDLGQSDLSDPQGRLLLGRLLPASALLHSRIMTTGEGHMLSARLIDTQTAEVLGVYSEAIGSDEDLVPACRALTQKTVERLLRAAPYRVPAEVQSNGLAVAGLGAFHRISTNSEFMVYPLVEPDRSPGPVGTARIVDLGAYTSHFRIQWDPDAQPLQKVVIVEP